uniref:Homeobox domain-containing protein n=1 Tax=Panagrolaimus davidi TaxID=227884 RepID=A0A914P7R1_9BILA
MKLITFDQSKNISYFGECKLQCNTVEKCLNIILLDKDSEETTITLSFNQTYICKNNFLCCMNEAGIGVLLLVFRTKESCEKIFDAILNVKSNEPSTSNNATVNEEEMFKETFYIPLIKAVHNGFEGHEDLKKIVLDFINSLEADERNLYFNILAETLLAPSCLPPPASSSPENESVSSSSENESSNLLETILDFLSATQNLQSQTTVSETLPCKSDLGSNFPPPLQAKEQYEVHVNSGSSKPLQEWMAQHINNPYPTKMDVQQLSSQTGFSNKQIRTWLRRNRYKYEQICGANSLPWIKKESRKNGSADSSSPSENEYASPSEMCNNNNFLDLLFPTQQYKIHVNYKNSNPLREWMNQNITNPYPTFEDVQQLSLQTEYTHKQIRTWFANARRKHEKECGTNPLPYIKKPAH